MTLQPGFKIIRSTDQLTIDEHLRIRRLRRYSAQSPVGVVAVQNKLLELDVGITQQALGADTERAAFTGEHGDIERKLTCRIEVLEHRVRIRHLERITGLFGLNEHLLDDAVAN